MERSTVRFFFVAPVAFVNLENLKTWGPDDSQMPFFESYYNLFINLQMLPFLLPIFSKLIHSP